MTFEILKTFGSLLLMALVNGLAIYRMVRKPASQLLRLRVMVQCVSILCIGVWSGFSLMWWISADGFAYLDASDRKFVYQVFNALTVSSSGWFCMSLIAWFSPSHND